MGILTIKINFFSKQVPILSLLPVEKSG